MAVSYIITEVFSFEYWHDLEIRGRSRSRSLKIPPTDRSYTTYYLSVFATMLYLATFSSYMTLNNIVTLKSRFRVTQGHWKWHHAIDCIRVPIRLPL